MSCLRQLQAFKTFGDFLGASPHLHILAADGGFGAGGMFYTPHDNINTDKLEPLFRHKVLSMLRRKGSKFHSLGHSICAEGKLSDFSKINKNIR